MSFDSVLHHLTAAVKHKIGGRMGCVNFEVAVFEDPRFYKLVALCGNDLDTACGVLIRSWTLARRWWKSPSKMIPLPEWQKHGIRPAVIESGMAEVRGDFVYVRGSQDRMNYLDVYTESGRKGGKRSAEVRKNKKETPVEIIDENSKRIQANPSESNPYTYSLEYKETTTTTSQSDNLRGQVREAHEVWTQTLASFGVPKTPMAPVQENSLARAIKQLGFENVVLALEGQRHEKPNT